MRATDLAAQNPNLLSDPENLAKVSWEYANNCVGQRGGWQDEYAAIYGGVNLWKFSRNGESGVMEITRTKINKEIANRLEKNLVLVGVGGPGVARRESSNIHDLVFGSENYKVNTKYIKEISESTRNLASSLVHGHLSIVPNTLNKIWENSRILYPSMESDNMKKLQEECAGLYSGAKAMGAGGDGSCMLFYTDSPDKKERLVEKIGSCGILDVRVIPFKFDYEGIKKEY